jgi:hypothetical protein
LVEVEMMMVVGRHRLAIASAAEESAGKCALAPVLFCPVHLIPPYKSREADTEYINLPSEPFSSVSRPTESTTKPTTTESHIHD